MFSFKITCRVNSIGLLIIQVLWPCIFLTVGANGAERFPAGKHNILPFSASANLIPNPDFSLPAEPKGSATDDVTQAPSGWFIGAGGMIHDSRFWLSPQGVGAGTAIGLTGGQDRQGKWNTVLPACNPGNLYRFKAEFYRNDLDDPAAYPELRIWGQTFRLNTLRMVRRFQPLHADVTCPKKLSTSDRTFSLINMYSGSTFWMRKPSLTKRQRQPINKQVPPKIDYFPIGVYGATHKNLQQIKAYGFNSAVIGLDQRNIAACLEQRVHCTFGVPQDPEKLISILDRFAPLLKKGDFSFYVNDEPGIHSFPAAKAAAIQRILKSRFPKSFTTMAIVRPLVIPDYQAGADYFLLDQYPVPHMPMIWLSESMDEAAGFVGADRLQSVIQAFGGKESARFGWPRLPTYAEMNCLTFLSIIHGSRGLYFFSYPDITSTPNGKEDLGRVVRHLNRLSSWLRRENEKVPAKVRMVSRYRFDPAGQPAVQCVWKRQNHTRMLLCVNTIRTSVAAEVESPLQNAVWRDYYSYKQYYTVDNRIHITFSPLAVQVLIEEH